MSDTLHKLLNTPKLMARITAIDYSWLEAKVREKFEYAEVR
jgi:hypothetical protein